MPYKVIGGKRESLMLSSEAYKEKVQNYLEKLGFILDTDSYIHGTTSDLIYVNRNIDPIKKFHVEVKATKDYVHIYSRCPVRFFPTGNYSQLRGTFFGKNNLNLLYTTGFIPAYNTYPGNRIAEPLLFDSTNVESSSIQVANDILSLSKLDWNSADFCKREPVTLLVSRKVGHILSEIRDKRINPQISYRYYM